MGTILIGAGLVIIGLVTAINTLNLMVVDAQLEDILKRLERGEKWN